MASLLVRIIFIAALSFVSGCQDLTYTVELPKSDLQEKLNEIVPVDLQEKTDCPFPAKLASLEVILNEADNQMGLHISFSANPAPPGPPFAPRPREIEGVISMTGELRFESEEGSFYFDEITVIDISGGAIPKQASSKLILLVERLVGGYLSKNPIYTLKEDELSTGVAKAFLKSFTVKTDSIHITLAP